MKQFAWLGLAFGTLVWTVSAGEPAAIRCDLAVIGGGSGGFGAALAAARMGLDVVLVEQADCLGGNAVRGGVNCWEPGVGGTGAPFDLYVRLKAIPNAVGIYTYGRHQSWYDPSREPYRYPGGETRIDPQQRYINTLQRHVPPGFQADAAYKRQHCHGVVFEPAVMARVMLDMLKETGNCRVLLQTSFVRTEARSNRVESVTLSNGQKLLASYYVDATGDGLLGAAAGAQVLRGQEARATFQESAAPTNSTHRINGVSLLYRVTRGGGSRIEPLPKDVPAKCWWAAAFPSSQITQYPNGDLNINMLPTMEGAEFLRLGYAPALAECQKRISAHWRNLQERFLEFQEFRFKYAAPALGIRESQRLLGEYVLTQHDLEAGLSGQKHPDIIALSDHPMDTHGSHQRGIGEMRQPYGVPYRCLVPKSFRNLLIACRAASFSSLAASSCRLSRTMMQLGQAAGTAAVMAHGLQVDLPDVPAERLRTALRQQHVQLEHPLPPALRQHLLDEPRAAVE